MKSLGLVTHACDPSIQKAKAGLLQVLGQPRLQSEILSLKIKGIPGL